jgi:signal transduction histidine kinase
MSYKSTDSKTQTQLGNEGPAPSAEETKKVEVCVEAMASQFQTILVQILKNTGLALGEISPYKPVRARIQQIESFAHNGREITRQLLTYVGRINTVFLPVNLNDLVEEMKNLQWIPSQQIKLLYDLCHDLPLIEADPKQIRRVIVNLIMNASEAIAEEGGSIRLETKVVQWENDLLKEGFVGPTLSGERFVSLVIADSGRGMDDAIQSRIFDPFFTTHTGRVGLGMTEVLGVIRIHGCAIKVDSTLGQGTTVRILFPDSVPDRELLKEAFQQPIHQC